MKDVNRYTCFNLLAHALSFSYGRSWIRRRANMLKVQTKTGVLILQKWLKNKQLRIISKGQEHPPMHQYLYILNWKKILIL